MSQEVFDMVDPNGGTEAQRVAVLGMGIMGSAMARKLLEAGFHTTVWDRTPAAMAPLSSDGATAAASAAEAIGDADVVVTMLPTAAVVNAVVFESDAVTRFNPRAVWAQMGTIGVGGTADIAQRLLDVRPDVVFVDAPVSGSKGPAENGELIVLASGPRAAGDVLTPVFAAIGRKTVWLGEAGQGSRMKLAVNAYLSMLVEAVAESLELAAELGIEASDFAAAVEGGPLDAPAAKAKRDKMLAGDFSAEFPLEWALKDVDLALEEAQGDALPLLVALSRQWTSAVATGHGRQDISAARLALGRRPSQG